MANDKSVNEIRTFLQFLFYGILENHSAIDASMFGFLRAGFVKVVSCRIIANTTICDAIVGKLFP